MTEKIRTLVASSSHALIFVIFGAMTYLSDFYLISLGCFISFIVILSTSLFIYFNTEDIKHLKDLNKDSSEKEIEGAVENVFINDLLSYASSRGINSSIDFSGQNGIFLQEEIGGIPIRICEIVLPDETAKVGDDLYKYTLEEAKEKIEKYIKENKTKKEEEKNDSSK